MNNFNKQFETFERDQSEVLKIEERDDNPDKTRTIENRLGKIYRTTVNGGRNILVEGEEGVMIHITKIEKLALENEGLNSSIRYLETTRSLPKRSFGKTKPYEYPKEIERGIEIGKNIGKIKKELLKGLLLSNLQIHHAITEYGIKVSVDMSEDGASEIEFEGLENLPPQLRDHITAYKEVIQKHIEPFETLQQQLDKEVDPSEALKDVAKVAGTAAILAAAMNFAGIQPNKAIESIIRPILGWGDSFMLAFSVMKQKLRGKKGGELDIYSRGTLKGMGLTSVLHGMNLSAEAVGFRSDTVRNMIKILFGSGDNLGGIFLGTVPENYKKLQEVHEERKTQLQLGERAKLILSALRENWKTSAMTRGTIYANLAMFTALQGFKLSELLDSEQNSTALVFEAATLGSLDTLLGLTLAIRDKKLKLTEEMNLLSENLPLTEQKRTKPVYIKMQDGKMHFLGFQPQETEINFKSNNG